MDKIAHIGIAVNSIAQALPFYTDILGMRVEQTETIQSEGVRATFVTGKGIRLELLEPTTHSSSISRFLERRGEGIHHIALGTEEIGWQLDRLSVSGVRLIDEHVRQGANNSQIAFIHPSAANGVLFELCQQHT